MDQNLNTRKFPSYGWIGLTLIILFWTLNWTLTGLRTDWGFFPLWLGYCLTIDAIVYKRKGTSLIKRNFKKYLILFLISAPAWWLFELLNKFTNNWYYDGRQYFTNLQYIVLASISFSTVMPAVFETAEFAGTFDWINKLKLQKPAAVKSSSQIKLFLSGFVMMILVLTLPKYFYYLVWISLYFIIDPINLLLKNKTLLEFIIKGDWRPLIALSVGCLMCGFFWEMWNFYSYPKWIYHLPFVNFLHIFEMPVLGYIGYIPFSLEIFALFHLITGIFFKGKFIDYIQII